MTLTRLPVIARVALLVALLSLCANAVVLGFIHLRTDDDALLELRQRVQEESIALSALATVPNSGIVAQNVARALQQGDPLLIVGVYDPLGRPVTGNVHDRIPVATLQHREFQELRLHQSGNVDKKEAGIVAQPISGHRWLISGRFFGERLALQRTLQRSLWLSLVLSLLFGLTCGLVVARFVAGRVRTISAVVDDAGTGNFKRRAPVVGSGDAFDRLSTRVNLMLDRLGALMSELGLITDSLAHDLRSPIGRLRSRIEQALDTEDDSQRQQLLSGGLQEVDSITRMLSIVLDIGRAEAMEGRDRFAWTDTAALIAELAEMYEPLANDSGMAVDHIVTGVLVPQCLHHQLISQALSNLADNAITYAAAGQRLHFFAEQSESECRLGVADAGTGIAAADQAEARRRFGRLDKSRSRPGAGLGLALVESIARLHGGKLELSDNQPGLRAAIVLPSTDQQRQ